MATRSNHRRRQRAALLVLIVCLVSPALPRARLFAQSEKPGAHPRVSVVLTDGSVVVGELMAEDTLGITVRTTLFGPLLVLRSNITTITSVGDIDAPVGTTTESPTPADSVVRWTRTATLGVNYAGATVPGYSGETRGAQLELGIERASALTKIGLNIDAGYQVTSPSPASMNEVSLSLVAAHTIRGPYSVRSETIIEHDAVAELDYRVQQQFNLGWTAIDAPAFSLVLAPGLGYTREHGAGPAALGDEPREKFKDARGAAVGFVEELKLRPTPALTISQNVTSFHGLDNSPRLQYTGTLHLLGMVSAHVGLTIEYKREYDSTTPAPILKTLDRVSSGLQITY